MKININIMKRNINGYQYRKANNINENIMAMKIISICKIINISANISSSAKICKA